MVLSLGGAQNIENPSSASDKATALMDDLPQQCTVPERFQRLGRSNDTYQTRRNSINLHVFVPCEVPPIKQDALSLRRFLRHSFYELLILTNDNELWASKIRKFIEKALTHIPNFNTVAETLGIPTHTLRRRLIEENTRYRDIKNQTRLDTALYYIGMHKLSIEQVSERAGFSEALPLFEPLKTGPASPRSIPKTFWRLIIVQNISMT